MTLMTDDDAMNDGIASCLPPDSGAVNRTDDRRPYEKKTVVPVCSSLVILYQNSQNTERAVQLYTYYHVTWYRTGTLWPVVSPQDPKIRPKIQFK